MFGILPSGGSRRPEPELRTYYATPPGQAFSNFSRRLPVQKTSTPSAARKPASRREHPAKDFAHPLQLSNQQTIAVVSACESARAHANLSNARSNRRRD